VTDAPPPVQQFRDADGHLLAFRRPLNRAEIEDMRRERDEREADARRASAWLAPRRKVRW
jgi:hypothetical protein